ncbi:MAG TPA: transposase [Ruminococcaceae bacterium]|nr:transposase [Oscillospiraceae bacterium]
MKNEYPIRKNLRLKDYDYSQNGAYFITMCTDSKKWLFGRYNVGAIHESPVRFTKDKCISLNKNGKICDKYIKQIPNNYSAVKVVNYIIMPNHIHLLLLFDGEPIRAIRESPLQRSLLSKVVGRLKMNISKEIHRQNNSDEKIWQRGYNERIIRNQREFENAWNYIEYNALKEYSKGERNERHL